MLRSLLKSADHVGQFQGDDTVGQGAGAVAQVGEGHRKRTVGEGVGTLILVVLHEKSGFAVGFQFQPVVAAVQNVFAKGDGGAGVLALGFAVGLGFGGGFSLRFTIFMLPLRNHV